MFFRQLTLYIFNTWLSEAKGSEKSNYESLSKHLYGLKMLWQALVTRQLL